jgi:putative GTP pyrophosphokinase
MHLNEKDLHGEYNRRHPMYYRLGQVVQQGVTEELELNNVEYDFVQMRVKTFTSFFEKAFRYQFTNPLTEMKDLCGIRIIHLFDNDLDKIKRLVKKRFKELKTIDKTLQSRDPSKKREREFSYRSYHVYATLREDDLRVNQDLDGLVAEIQIRTICMHAWASIEHKLNYKKQQDLPNEFRPVMTRKFSQMSAMLELADELFVALRNEKNRVIEKYKTELAVPVKKEKLLDDELNIDVLQAYIEQNFAQYRQELSRFKYLLGEMQLSQINLRDIEKGKRLLKDRNLLRTLQSQYPSESGVPTQTGIVRLILDATNDAFYGFRRSKLGESKWTRFVDDLRSQLHVKH